MNTNSYWRMLSLVWALSLSLFGFNAFADTQWPMQSGTVFNTNNPSDKYLNKSNIASLTQLDLSESLNMGATAVTPSIVGNMLYVSDWKGNLYGFNIVKNELVWKKNFITDYSNDPKLGGKKVYVNYITPTVSDNLILVGNNYPGGISPSNYTAISGAVLMAVDRKTGNLVWASVLDDVPTAIITASPVVNKGVAYVGVSTYESGIPGSLPLSLDLNGDSIIDNTNDYTCCVFRGSVVAVNLADGKILWKTYLMPLKSGEQNYHNRPNGPSNAYGASFSGASVWGGQLVFDSKRNQVYATTSQTHNLPLEYPMNSFPAGTANDALVALNAKTGEIKWMHNYGRYPGARDVWNLSCIIEPLQAAALIIPSLNVFPNSDPTSYQQWCRTNLATSDYAIDYTSATNLIAAVYANPFDFNKFFTAFITAFTDPNGVGGADRDFPQGAMLIQDIKIPGGSKHDMVVSMQKTAVVHAVDPDTGASIWDSATGPGGAENSRSSAYDGTYIYTLNGNLPGSFGFPTPIKALDGTTSYTTASYLSALKPVTGEIVWQAPLPNNSTGGRTAMVVVNGMILVGDRNAGNLYALDTSDGSLITTYTTNASFGTQVAPAIVNGTIYWATGLAHPDGTSILNVGQLIKLSP